MRPPPAFYLYHSVCWFAMLISVFCPALQGRDLYVSTAPGAADTNAGTLAKPWRTIQKAANSVVAGDTVYIRGNGGVYSERVTITNRVGPIVFLTYPGDPTAIIDQTGIVPPASISALLHLDNSNFITISNLELRNYKTDGTSTLQIPSGILLEGASNGVAVRNCKVHDIWQNSLVTGALAANGFGIAVYGNNLTAVNGLILDGNEVYNLRTGSSESVTLNGNVTNFTVTNNLVHDCNNIGIDFIGFEGTVSNPLLDQARFGLCAGNVVYNIDSKFNPAYGGNFTTGGDDTTRSAPGLYVDGGRDLVIERNKVSACNFALSIGSEALGKVASNVVARNNLFHHCHVGGVVMGGSGLINGGATNCSLLNNTIYGNDPLAVGGGQISLQNYLSNISIQRNLLASPASFVQFISLTNTNGSFTAGAIDWNYYKIDTGASYEFYWNNLPYSDFSLWKSSSGLSKDAHSTLSTGNLGLTNNTPTNLSPAADFALTATSVLKNLGDSAALPFVPVAGEKDYFGKSRVASFRVDIGASEYLTAYQNWLDLYFQKPDGGTGANPNDDPDADGMRNLIEYSQGANPTLPDNFLAPSSSQVAGRLRLSYRKAAPELTYGIEKNSALNTLWSLTSTVTVPEQTNGTGLFWRDLPLSGSRGFYRFKVTQP